MKPQTYEILTDLAKRFAPKRIWLVGGTVRDLMLDRQPNDLDIATDALPDVSAEILEDWGTAFWAPGKDYGTVCGTKAGVTVEVTTLRADSYDNETRKPTVEFGTSIQDDLLRRDFTINAMAVRIHPNGTQTVVFIPNSSEDLCNLVLRTPLNPEVSFSDDPLRMIRAARFVSQIPGLTVETNTYNAMCDMKGQLKRVSSERIIAELDKMLLGDGVYEATKLLGRTGITELLVPEASRWAIDATFCTTIETGWAAWFLDGSGSKAQISERLRTLKHNSKIIKRVPEIVSLARELDTANVHDKRVTAESVRRFIWRAKDLIGPAIDVIRSAGSHNDFIEAVTRIGAPTYRGLQPQLTGDDVKALLNIPQGKLVGGALAHLQESILAYGPFANPIAEGRELLKWWEG